MSSSLTGQQVLDWLAPLIDCQLVHLDVVERTVMFTYGLSSALCSQLRTEFTNTEQQS